MRRFRQERTEQNKVLRWGFTRFQQQDERRLWETLTTNMMRIRPRKATRQRTDCGKIQDIQATWTCHQERWCQKKRITVATLKSVMILPYFASGRFNKYHTETSIPTSCWNGLKPLHDTLWLFNMAMGNGTFIEVYLLKMVIFHCYVR